MKKLTILFADRRT